jgi:hypothetical protein
VRRDLWLSLLSGVLVCAGWALLAYLFIMAWRF